MVREILGSEEELYIKSISTSWGVRVERWEFSIESWKYAMNSYDSRILAVLGLAGLTDRGLEQYYPTLVFTNEKLTGIYR